MAGRVTQVATEVLVSPTDQAGRATQIVLEQVIPGSVYGTPSNPNCRVTQICIEVIHERMGQRPLWQNTYVGHATHCGAIGGLM